MKIGFSNQINRRFFSKKCHTIQDLKLITILLRSKNSSFPRFECVSLPNPFIIVKRKEMAPLNRVKTNEKGNSKKNYDKCKEHKFIVHLHYIIIIIIICT